MALTKAAMAERLFTDLGLNKREAKDLVDLFFRDCPSGTGAGRAGQALRVR